MSEEVSQPACSAEGPMTLAEHSEFRDFVTIAHTIVNTIVEFIHDCTIEHDCNVDPLHQRDWCHDCH